MPYADPQKQREAQARWYREKYQENRKFRRHESERKSLWLQTPEGKASNAAASARARKKAKRKPRKIGLAPKAKTRLISARRR